jgi:ABC-type nitrate/sulfonate/bicarbonate transport system substrate-binding protein
VTDLALPSLLIGVSAMALLAYVVAALIPEYQFTAIIVEDGWAKAHRSQTAAFLRALRRGTDYILAQPDTAAAIGAKELKTTVPLASRALADMQKLGILSKDLSMPAASLRRVFVALQDAGVVGRDTAYDPARFVDESYLNESRR